MTNAKVCTFCTTDSAGNHDKDCPMNPVKNPVFKNYGWVCPNCGRGNSPWTNTCPCIPFQVWC